MSPLFNILSRLVITFFPRSKHLLISWLPSPSAVILDPKKIKSVTVFIDAKAEHWRIAFELWCWKRLLRLSWTARRSNQSILKEISPGCSLEGLMLKLKLQYFGHLMWRTESFEKTLMLGRLKAGREGDNRGWDGWLSSPTQWTWVWVNSKSWWWTVRPGVLQSMELQRVRHNWATELRLKTIQGSRCDVIQSFSVIYPRTGSIHHGYSKFGLIDFLYKWCPSKLAFLIL